MALNRQQWISEIQPNLYPTNEFYNYAKNHDVYVNNNIVHIPQAGTMPTALINPPVPISGSVKRTDADLTYSLATIVCPAMYVNYIEEVEFSYDIRSSYISDIVNTLNSGVGDYVAYNWANTPGTNVVRTSGSLRTPYGANQTGTRRALTLDNVREAQRTMDYDDVPQEGRKMLVDAGLYSDLLQIDEFDNSYILTGKAVEQGVVGKICGFDVMKRSRTLYYDQTAAAKIGVGVTVSATDNLAAICWHPSFVSRAKTNVKLFGLDRPDPLYMEYVVSANVRYGGAKIRTNEEGVVTIVEQA